MCTGCIASIRSSTRRYLTMVALVVVCRFHKGGSELAVSDLGVGSGAYIDRRFVFVSNEAHFHPKGRINVWQTKSSGHSAAHSAAH